MFRFKFIISISIFSLLLVGTSIVKNKTRELEKKIYLKSKAIHLIEKDLNESYLDFSYLTSPSIIEKKIELLESNKYFPMKHSKIFLNLSDFIDLKNKLAIQEFQNEKKIKKK